MSQASCLGHVQGGKSTGQLHEIVIKKGTGWEHVARKTRDKRKGQRPGAIKAHEDTGQTILLHAILKWKPFKYNFVCGNTF